MKLPLALSVGVRYVLSPRDFLSSVASLAVLGLALSIAILLVVQAVLSGFEYELRNRVLGVMPHVSIHSLDGPFDAKAVDREVRQLDHINAGSPAIEGMAMLVSSRSEMRSDEDGGNLNDGSIGRTRSGATEPVVLEGIVPETHHNASKLQDFVDPQQFARLQPGSFELLIGSVSASRLGVTKGDFLTILLPSSQVTLLGYLPRQKRARIAGVVETSTFLDRNRAYMHIDDAARLLRIREGATAYKLQVDDPFSAPQLAFDLTLSLDDPSMYSNSWAEQYGYLYGAVMSSRYVLLVIFSLLVAVAAFNLVSTVVVMISERSRDVAVLRTLGGNRRLISSAFLVAGFSISCVGLVLGCVLGVVIGWILEIGFPWIESVLNTSLLSEYFVHSLNVRFAFSDFVTVLAIGLVLCLLAILVPSIRAAQLNPATVLRHD